MPENLTDRPDVTLEQATELATQLYGIHGTAVQLPGERDQNFRIDARTDSWVLKCANLGTSFEFLEFENQAIRLSHSIVGLSVPDIVKTVDRESIVSAPLDESGSACWVRCFSFVPGRPLANVDERSSDLHRSLGKGIGSVDNALQLLNHNKLARRTLKWDLAAGGQVVSDNLPCVARDRHELLKLHLSRYSSVADSVHGLAKSVIHNDANDYNWLVDMDVETGETRIGLIDFGDIIYSTTINELAICCAYVMLERPDPLKTAAQVVAGYHASRELNDAEIRVLYPLICLRLSQSVAIAAEQKQVRPDDDYLTVTERPAWQLLEQLAGVDPDEVAEIFFNSCYGSSDDDFLESESRNDLITRRQSVLLPSLSLSYERPLKIVRGKGQYLYDDNDVTYLDCVNNVCHVGHCHPDVVAAISGQAATLNTNTRYLHANVVELAERLLAKMPAQLEVCVFVNSGSEANDLALRMAKKQTLRKEFVVIDHAYHGHTDSLIEISPYKFNGPGGNGPGDCVHVLPLPDGFRGQFRYEQTGYGVQYVTQAKQKIRQWVDDGRQLAAFFAESIPGCAGQIPLPAGYLKSIYDAIRSHGGVCVADEVQTGFGRVGNKFWGFELQGVIPDIVTLGKPFGNGHPLAAVVTTREIAEAFDNRMEYFNSFGGNPVSAAAGLAVLDVIEKEQLQAQAKRVGEELLQLLGELKTKYAERLGDVRGCGLFLGIEFVRELETRTPDSGFTKQVVEAMKRKNILLSTDGYDGNVIKIKPPLAFDSANAQRLVSTLDRVLSQLTST